MHIQFLDISRHFGTFAALRSVNLVIPDGELVALLGPSGSGKTTLLRIAAGLEQPDSGRVFLGERDVTDLSVAERRIGFVFQHYALFRHMTVFDNVSFGLRIQPRAVRPSRAEIAERVGKILTLLQIDSLSKRYPSMLSGGQRQRVALARALITKPQLMLLDEPFGALDAKVRKELRRWLRRLHDELHVTTIFVTHDQEEALEVADRIVVMNEGRIEQIGSPASVYEHPANPFVFEFLGSVNLFHGRVENGEAHFGELRAVSNGFQGSGSLARGYVRPHEFEVRRHPPSADFVRVKVQHVVPFGGMVQLEVIECNRLRRIELEVTKDVFANLGVATHDELYIRPQQIRVFAEDGVAGAPLRIDEFDGGGGI